MGHGTASRRLWHLAGGVVSSVLLLTTSPAATTHIIQFGGSFGHAYSPNSLLVTVGDTIQWQGDFGMHPLSSTTIPAGATSWHNDAGTLFNYVVSVPGTYEYQCDVHFASGMVGSFVAATAGVELQQTSESATSYVLEQNYPNPFNPTTKIQFTIVN